MKKNRMMRLASVLLICVLLTTSVISGTFAKYTSTATAADTARVAKWEINYSDKVNNTAKVNIVGNNNTISFDLFNTVTDDGEVTGGTDDENVANGTGTMIIAPGTGGKFLMNIENASEVTAEYTIALSQTQSNLVEDSKPIPIEYSLDGTEWKTSIADLNPSAVLAMGASAEVTVYWRWAFIDGTVASRDADDTALGTATDAPSVTVTATITVTQVD